MTWHTNPAVIQLRSLARKAGLTRPLSRLMPNRGYEAAFDDAVFSALREGDVVWDVGANTGYYTKRFVEAVGPDGHVVAFEPFPETAERLRAQMEDTSNYSLQTLALGAEDGEVSMQAGDDDLGATSRIIGNQEHGVTVRIATGDGLLGRNKVAAPTVIKIDTEGFELDVLHGIAGQLKNPCLRAIFVEVHFGLLAERKQPRAPAEIESLLKSAGFATRWVDPSHIAAERA